MNTLDALIRYFETFPGVGARQAKRFAFHVLRMGEADAKELARLVENIKTTVTECPSCHRYFSNEINKTVTCSICSSSNRNHNRLLGSVDGVDAARLVDVPGWWGWGWR